MRNFDPLTDGDDLSVKKKKRSSKKKAASRSGRSGSGSGAPMIPFDRVDEIVDFLEERGLEEFEFEREGFRIRVKRQSTASVIHAAPAAAASLPAPPAPVPEESAANELGEDIHVVKSPIVGTFYEAPRPGAPPFVKVGDQVKTGQTLCIVEAMKLMNEIEADVDGEIVRFFGKNAEPVEYGEQLFAIRTK